MLIYSNVLGQTKTENFLCKGHIPKQVSCLLEFVLEFALKNVQI